MMATNNTLSLLTIYGSLLIAGFAASLHCIGMCGPILLGFAEVFERTRLTINGEPASDDPGAKRTGSVLLDFVSYHAGRIWTYGLLGFGVGVIGQSVLDRGNHLGLQFPLAITVSAMIILSGVILLGVLPVGRFGAWLTDSSTHGLIGRKWLANLTDKRGWIARMLLGVVMGFLPCGMVYAVLLVVVSLPTPLHSAAGMIIFGVGTLPSLTGVLLAHRVIPRRICAHGSRLVAVIIIMSGSWMMARTVIVSSRSSQGGVAPNCHSTISDVFDGQPHGHHTRSGDEALP